MVHQDVPTDLIDAFRKQRGAVFLGAGASVAAGLPTWQGFISALALDLGLQPTSGVDTFSPLELTKIPQYYENKFNRRRLLEKLDSLLDYHDHVESKVHDLVTQLPCELFYTTNFDELLEASLRRQRLRFATIVTDTSARAFAGRRGRTIRKIHGSISHPDSLIVTRSDYAQFVRENEFTIDTLQNDLTQNTFLFIGYSLSDPDFNSIYDHVLFTMGRMRQTHFMCVSSVTELEAQDLRQRGIEPIELTPWPGDTLNDKLVNFLQCLVESTNEVVHITRFFHGLERDQEVPIVISSSVNAVEKFVNYPGCDIAAATQVQRALDAMGTKSRVIADTVALNQWEQLIIGDLILVCSPFGNAFTRYVFEQQPARYIRNRIEFAEDAGGRFVLNVQTGDQYRAHDPLAADGNRTQVEYCVLARFQSPWSPGRRIFLIAGLYAIGTHAASTFLSDLMNYQTLPWREGDVVAVLQVTYTSHDPYQYEYQVDKVEHL